MSGDGGNAVWEQVEVLSQLGARRDHFAVVSGNEVIFGFGECRLPYTMSLLTNPQVTLLLRPLLLRFKSMMLRRTHSSLLIPLYRHLPPQRSQVRFRRPNPHKRTPIPAIHEAVCVPRVPLATVEMMMMMVTAAVEMMVAATEAMITETVVKMTAAESGSRIAFSGD